MRMMSLNMVMVRRRAFCKSDHLELGGQGTQIMRKFSHNEHKHSRDKSGDGGSQGRTRHKINNSNDNGSTIRVKSSSLILK